VGGIDAAGVHHVEGAPVPFGFPEKTVARRAGRIIYNRQTLAYKTVE
jgi:hypothetical protein